MIKDQYFSERKYFMGLDVERCLTQTEEFLRKLNPDFEFNFDQLRSQTRKYGTFLENTIIGKMNGLPIRTQIQKDRPNKLIIKNIHNNLSLFIEAKWFGPKDQCWKFYETWNESFVDHPQIMVPKGYKGTESKIHEWIRCQEIIWNKSFLTWLDKDWLMKYSPPINLIKTKEQRTSQLDDTVLFLSCESNSKKLIITNSETFSNNYIGTFGVILSRFNDQYSLVHCYQFPTCMRLTFQILNSEEFHNLKNQMIWYTNDKRIRSTNTYDVYFHNVQEGDLICHHNEVLRSIYPNYRFLSKNKDVNKMMRELIYIITVIGWAVNKKSTNINQGYKLW